MGYKLEITQKASEHLDQLLAYLLNPLKSDQAANIFFRESKKFMIVWKKIHGNFQHVSIMCFEKRNTGRKKYRAWHIL